LLLPGPTSSVYGRDLGVTSLPPLFKGHNHSLSRMALPETVASHFLSSFFALPCPFLVSRKNNPIALSMIGPILVSVLRHRNGRFARATTIHYTPSPLVKFYFLLTGRTVNFSSSSPPFEKTHLFASGEGGWSVCRLPSSFDCRKLCRFTSTMFCFQGNPSQPTSGIREPPAGTSLPCVLHFPIVPSPLPFHPFLVISPTRLFIFPVL